MGIFDAVKSRLGRADQEEYYDDEEYYEEEYADEGEYQDNYQDNFEEEYANDASSYRSSTGSFAASGRSSSFNELTPLVSMSDVRSQELPPLESNSLRTAARARQTQPAIKTSMPYVDESSAHSTSQSRYSDGNTGALNTITSRGSSVEAQEYAQTYTAADSQDPLLKRHSLSNTGDFSATSPAYYASRSGVGHVRPSGQVRRTHKFREAVVIRPESYAESEQVAVNIRRGNAVVLVLTLTRPELAKRILDFSFGAAAVSEGQVASIGERIYAITTEHELTETELELLQARGII